MTIRRGREGKMIKVVGHDPGPKDLRNRLAHLEQSVFDLIAAGPNFDEVLKQNSALEQSIREAVRKLIAEDEKAEPKGGKQPSAGKKGEEVVENIVFYPVPQSISNEILELSEAMNDAYLEKEADRVIEKESGAQKDEVVEDSRESWRSRLIEGLSKSLFHSSEEETQMPEEEFRAVFQKEIAERIYDHLAMLTRAGYEEGDEPFSIMEEFTRMMVGKLGLGLSRNENIGEELKHRVELVLHKLAWDFQSWLILEHNRQYSAVFGEIHTSVPEKMPANGKLLVLADDVAPPLESLMEPARAREPQLLPIDDIFVEGGTEIPQPRPVWNYNGFISHGEAEPVSPEEIISGSTQVDPRVLRHTTGPVYLAGHLIYMTEKGVVTEPFSHGGIFIGGPTIRGFQPISGMGDFMMLRSAVRQVKHGSAILGAKVRK